MNARDADPYGAHRFRVTCDALPKMGFSQVRGLSVSVVVPDAEEDNGDSLSSRARRSHKRHSTCKTLSDQRETTSPTLDLRRGVTDEQALWMWFQSWVAGGTDPQDVRICLLDTEGKPARGWVCRAATPVRWRGPDLDAEQAAVAMETLELAYEGIDAITDLTDCEE